MIRFVGLWILGICLVACSPVPQVDDLPDSGQVSPDQEAWGWTTVVTRDGRKRVQLEAAHFRKYDASRKAELDGGVTVWFFDATGQKRVSELTANRAEIDEETGDLMVAGNVLLASTDSTRLETDTLRWLREDEKVSGDGQVTIRRPDGRETGVGFEATSDLKRWTLHRVTTHLARADTL